jgi:Flp pilus assembly protein TadG
MLLSKNMSRKPVLPQGTRTRAGQKGHSAVEVALILPWLVYCFVGAFDLGIYSYALISAQSAARVVGMYASSSTSTAQNPAMACTYALAELQDSPGMATTSSCASGGVVGVSTSYLATGADGLPAAQVSITYKPPQLIGLPGMLSGKLSITRTVEFPIRGS